MSSVVKKIFDTAEASSASPRSSDSVNAASDGEIDEEVHGALVKFSKGSFPDRWLVESKKQKDKWAVKTSAEFANFLVRECLPAEGNVEVKGVVVSTEKLADVLDLPVERVKQFMGIKQNIISGEIEVEKIREAMEKYPRAFFALSFSTDDCVLKIKAKAPKSAKPSTKGDKEVKIDFCSVKTTNEELVRDLLFDCLAAKHVRVSHEFVISEIELPAGVEDPVEIRERAVRKGVLKRTVVADGAEKQSEAEFAA